MNRTEAYLPLTYSAQITRVLAEAGLVSDIELYDMHAYLATQETEVL